MNFLENFNKVCTYAIMSNISSACRYKNLEKLEEIKDIICLKGKAYSGAKTFEVLSKGNEEFYHMYFSGFSCPVSGLEINLNINDMENLTDDEFKNKQSKSLIFIDNLIEKAKKLEEEREEYLKSEDFHTYTYLKSKHNSIIDAKVIY